MARQSKRDKRKSETRLAPEEDPEFQIAPMIDILLVLLVFFMSISSTEVLQVNKEISLPVAKDAKDPDKNPGQAIINVIWKAGSNEGVVELDEQKYASADNLVPILARRMERTPDMRVLIRADRNVEFSFMREIMKAVGAAGIANVTFSAVDKETVQTDAPEKL